MRGNAEPLEQRLREGGGKTARAMITATKPGKVVTSDDPAQAGIPQVVWKVTFRIFPDDRSPFNTVAKVLYPQKGGGPPAGSEVGVLYDPRDPSKLVIDRSAPTDSWGAVQEATMARMMPPGTGGPDGPLVIAGGRVISPAPAAEAPSVVDQLTKLVDLKDRGVLTEPEFQAQKAKLLGT
jgi:hypothetical protein